MLMPLPSTLSALLTDYEKLATETPNDELHGQRLRDLTYTLCVSTGTRTIDDALTTARAYLNTHITGAFAPAA
ncbi:DUF5133 domain-containing protein [Streptomyces sp. NPDC060187]|uniref:DUF5133 domain-containing protein n=1 Tax=Streptomyces sp. NPDC060187 TaxID=3347067 RepID=UPI0036515C49